MDEQKLLKRKKKAQTENSTILLASVCTDLAELYVTQGRHQLAIEEYQIVSGIYQRKKQKIEYARVNRGIGEAYTGLQEFEKALKHQYIYLNIAIEEENKLEEQRAYATIGHTYQSWYLETETDFNKNLNSAYKYFTKSFNIAESLTGISKLEKADMKARLLANMGLVRESQGNFKGALEYIRRSIEICNQNNIHEQLIRGYLAVASLFEKQGQFNHAIYNYDLAINVARKLKNKVKPICEALLAKSEAFIKLADFHSAKQVLVKAYKLKSPNIQERELIERNLRIVASMCYTEDKLVTTALDDLIEKQKLYETMGDGACILKNYSKAIEYYKLTLNCVEKAGLSGRDLASCYYSLAETYRDDGMFDKAVEYFEKEYALCIGLKNSLNTLCNIIDTKESAKAPVSEIMELYERSFAICRQHKSLKEEKRLINRYVIYLRRNDCNVDAFEMIQFLESLGEQDGNNDSESSSENESEDSEAGRGIGREINLDEITDKSDDSDVDNYVQNIRKRRNRSFAIKKNQLGETQLHKACINNNAVLVRHLVEQGHPLNVRDNYGWSPFHEACNYGYYEIVKYLIEKGVALNDRGGSSCEGITPLYDAARNGHLRVVKLLLDNETSCTIKTNNGETALNALKKWKDQLALQKIVLEKDELDLYDSLVKRMTEIMERAGQRIEPFVLKDTKSLVDEDQLKKLFRNRQSRVIMHHFDGLVGDRGSSSSSSGSDIKNEYRKVMVELRKKSNASLSPLLKTTSKRSALVAAEENPIKDWLEDDLQGKNPKKRKIGHSLALLTPSLRSDSVLSNRKKCQSPKKKLSIDSNSIEDLFEEDLNNGFVLMDNKDQQCLSSIRRLSSESRSSSESIKKKQQSSLLDAGFSRTRSTRFDKKSLKYQQRSTSLGHIGKIVEADSTNQGFAEQVQHATVQTPSPDLMGYVDIKIEKKLFRVPVLQSQIQTNSVGWLAEQAAVKYAKKECTKPTLEIETSNGALLTNDDPLSVLFPLGAMRAESVIGKVVKMSLPPLIQRYRETCRYMELEPDNDLSATLEEMSITLNLSNSGMIKSSLAPLCKALSHQSSLSELNLSANFLNEDCFFKLFRCLPTLSNLSNLNLSSTGLYANNLNLLVDVLTSSCKLILQKLSVLDLSDNFLGNKSLKSLSVITNHLKLTSLNLSNVGFTSGVSQIEDAKLNLSDVEKFDISDNRLNSKDVLWFVFCIEALKLNELNVSRNDKHQFDLLKGFVGILGKENKQIALKSLNLSRCNVQDNELHIFLSWLPQKTLKEINLSYNQSLTGISLRRLLECSTLTKITLLSCENIFKYFDGVYLNLPNKGNGNEEIILKISASLQNCQEQVEKLLELFKSKFSDCNVERTDRFLFVSSKTWRFSNF